MSNFTDTLLDIRDDILDFVDDHRKGLIIFSFIDSIYINESSKYYNNKC